MIGASAEAIDKAEDRALFREAMTRSAWRRRARNWRTRPTIIGAGPIVIGQACEFDYSGTQACKALQGGGLPDRPGQFQSGDDHDRSGSGRRHLYRADHAGDRRQDHREGARRDALLPTMGGQTALNCALSLAQDGRAREIRRRDDRRHRRRDRQGRGPRAVPRGDDQDRPRDAALASGQDAGRRRWRRSTTSACRRSSGRPSRSAAPAAASPTTRRSSSRSSSAASTPRRPTRC